MAVKPTIYKFNISLSDLDRNYYDTLNLTVALHPSETVERMMVRVLALSLNAEANPAFTKGLSEPDEPEIVVRTLDNLLDLWIDVGEPTLERIKKASRQANQYKLYSFNSKSDIWWEQIKVKCSQMKVDVFQFQWHQTQSLAELVSRTMQFSMTVTGTTLYIAAEAGECELEWRELQSRT